MLAARFNRKNVNIIESTHTPLGEEQLRRHVPAVFAESAHESRSERYAYIPTINVLRGLFSAGFQPFFAMQSRSRDASRAGHTKHMLRFRHADHIARDKPEVNEVILINSHDGGSSYQMLVGTFRFICLNGLVVGDKLGEVRVRHSGNVQTEVVTGAHELLRAFEAIDASKDAMKSVQLTEGEQTAFGRAALALRYPEHQLPPINAAQVIEPRRWDDKGQDLWATFNRAQENLTRGGVRTNDRNRRTHTRAVQSIDGNVALNRGLWTLAEEMRKIKTGA